MLEHYFIKPSTVDRIRANAAGPYIERYVEWMLSQGYADRNVLRRVPMLCQFGDFAKRRGAIDGQSALEHVEAFAAHWQALHGRTCKTADARRKVAHDARTPVRQMLEFALRGRVGQYSSGANTHESHLHLFPFQRRARQGRISPGGGPSQGVGARG